MNYYRKHINNTVNDVKLKMQIGALTLEITENINKINDLFEVDKNINKDVTNNFKRISINEKSIKFKTDTINSNINEIKYTLTNIGNDLSNFKVNENVAYITLKLKIIIV